MCFVSVARLGSYIFHPDFSQCANRHKENVSLSIDYSTIKVMVILNNMICDEYSWGEKYGD